MDELDLVRAARPPEDYPDERRAATRAAVLAGMAGATQAQQAGRLPRSPRARLAGRWRAGLVAALAGCAATTVVTVHAAERPVSARPSQPAAGSVGRVLELAARAIATTQPPGTRWIVTESWVKSTAWRVPECGGTVRVANSLAYTKLSPGPAACPAAPPATLPELHTIRAMGVNSAGTLGYPMGLPGRPGALLTALYRWLNGAPRDWLPGRSPPRVSPPNLYLEAFRTLVLMITQGVTTPGQGVLLAALGMIPGVKVVRLRASQQIAVAISASVEQDTMLMDARSYKIIGDRDTLAAGGSNPVTVTDIPLWRAYYDASGHRL